MKLSLITSTLLLASCHAPEAERQSPDTKPRLVKPPQDVRGEWQVVIMNGSPPETGPSAIRVQIDTSEIRARSRCVKWVWTYRLSGSSIDTTRKENAKKGCKKPLTARENRFERTMEGATQLRHLTDGGLYLAKGAETMVLSRHPDNH